MTKGKTDVVLNELDTYARNSRERATLTDGNADNLGNVLIDAYTFGAIGHFFRNDVTADIDSLASDTRNIATRLNEDAETLEINSSEFKNAEQDQQDQFVNIDRELPGGQ